MHPISTYGIDNILVQEHQATLIRRNLQAIGPVRRVAGALLIQIGEWLRGKADTATDARTETSPASLKAA